MMVNHHTIPFSEVFQRVKDITITEETTKITNENAELVCDADDFSEYGLSTLGKTVGFPAPFILQLNETNPALADDVIRDRVNLYFENGKPEFYARRFLGKIRGVVSNKYSYFDDDEVVEILSDSPLANMGFQNALITPERFHVRAIDEENPFHINNDPSVLYFAFFIDNSMVGQSSFKVQLGIYRLACTNGLIVPVREFVICRQIHRGRKDIAAEFNESIAFLKEKQESIKEMLSTMGKEKATIETLKEEFRKDYLAKKLNLNRKETEKVIELYKTVYDGQTKWGMVNAITEFARDIKDINRREYIEKAALKAA